MDLSFEELREENLSDVLSIYTYYILNTTATFHAHALSVDEMREIVFFKNPKYKTYLIKSAKDICGYVLLTQYKKREAYDDTAEVTIYLKPEYTAQGIGRIALNFIEDEALRQKLHVLVASICSENSGSVKLFENNGYTKCAHFKDVGKKFGRRLDIFYYQKILS